MTENRKDCPMRHENGNCNVIGGFCTAVNDPICAGLHNAYDCGYCDGEIRAKREQGQSARWISVKDRLPEQTEPAQKVLFITETGGVFIGCYYKGSTFDKFDGWYSMCVRVDNVTHWMPLPDPPEEDA